MEEEDDDTHQCRACKMVIQGLDNYVQHRKFSCVRLAGKKSQIDEGKTCSIPVASDSASKCSDYFRPANSEEDDKVDVLSEAFTATCTDKTGPATQNENHPASSSFQSPISESERDDAENVHSQSLEDTEESDRLPMIMTVECVDVEDQPEEPRKIPFLLQQHTSRMDFSCKTCAVEFSDTFKLKQHFASKAHRWKVGYAEGDAEKTKEKGSGGGESSRSPSMAMTVDCVNDDLSSDDGCGFGPEDIEDGDRLHDEDTPDATDSASKMDTDVQDTYCDVCKYDYSYPSRLKAHLKAEKHLRVVAALGGTAQSESYCEVCQKDFWSKSKLEKHLSSKRHIRAAGEATTNTREKSNKDTTVKVGEDIKRGNEGQDTYCDICKYEYSYPSRLEAHLKTEKHLRAAAALGETVNDEDSTDATTDIPNETTGMKSETESSMQNVEESATRNQGEAVKEESNREEASKETNVDVTTERNMQNDRRVRSEKKRKKRKKKLTQIDNSDCSSAVDPDEHPEASDYNVYRKKARNNGTAPNHAKLKRKRKKYRERVKVGKKLACKYCNMDFSTASHLYKHAVRYLEKKEDHNPLYLCYPCRHVAYSSEEYEEHCKTQDHAVYQELYNHIEEKQGSYLKYSCNICEYQTPNKHEIERHVPKHLVENGKVFSCDRCEKSFHSYRGRQRHIEAVHEHKMEKTIVCEVCGKRFYNWVSCGTHMSLHKGLKPYKCTHEGCTYRGKAPSDLKYHMMRHAGEKPYLCDRCSFASVNRQGLNRHIRHKHTRPAERLLKCDQCKYTTLQTTNLRRHMITHTGEKPHKCPHCSYRCNDVDNLRKHILKSKKHEGVKLYNCSTCGDFGTNKLRDYFNHMKTTHGMDIVRDYEGSFMTGVTVENMKPRFVRISSSKPQESAGSTDKQGEEVSSAVAAIVPNDNIPDGGESGEATQPLQAVSILEDLVEEMSASLQSTEEEQQDTENMENVD